MNEEEKKRLNHLKKLDGFVDGEFIRNYYGIELDINGSFFDAISDYAKSLKIKLLKQRKELILFDRFAIENFFQKNDVIPLKWMAAFIGVKLESLYLILKNLKPLGLILKKYVFIEGLISNSFRNDLIDSFYDFKFMDIGNHNNFTKLIIEIFNRNFKLQLKPEFCSASWAINEKTIRYSSYIDCITFLPIAMENSIFLNFGKPMNLAPDRCSKLFYVQNEESLKEFVLGSIDQEKLEKYRIFLGKNNVK